MATTYFEDIDELIQKLVQLKEKYDNHHVLLSSSWHGSWTSPSKKNPNYRMGFAMNGELFKKDCLKNFDDENTGCCVLAIIPKEKFDEKKIEEMLERENKEE